MGRGMRPKTCIYIAKSLGSWTTTRNDDIKLPGGQTVVRKQTGSGEMGHHGPSVVATISICFCSLFLPQA